MRWVERAADEAEVTRLARDCGLAASFARLLAARGLRSAEQVQRFLSPSLSHLHSPYAMLGMDKAVDRLRRAIAQREPILIYGDYDVDGTTAVVILKTAIELCGGAADFHVPHRIREGYDMQSDVIERAAAAGVRLIISVDMGIRAFAAAQTAQRLGVDLIVTDHHLPDAGEGLPAALAVLNPNQPGCAYPCKALCGAGVAFKLAQALLDCDAAPQAVALAKAGGRERLLISFLKVVAIATIADAVPLVDENRVFAKIGLAALRRPVNPGLKALLETASLGGGGKLTAGDVAFRVAPRLNAAGRMDVARDVIDLFTEKDGERARQIAARLNQLNSDRQEEERRIMAAVEERLAAPDMQDAYCLVVDGDAWHRGVIGIAATRVVERACRPAIVISRDGGEAYGSGRSIRGFHLLEALESCHNMFTRFGGHAHAVGFSLPVERVPALRAALESYARQRLTPADFIPAVTYDAELALDDVTPELYQSVQRMEPFGMANPEPVFVARRVKLLAPPRVLKEKHVKLRLAVNGGRGRGLDALGWRMADRVQQHAILAGDLLDIAFTLEHNDHPDFGGLELRLEDVVKVAA